MYESHLVGGLDLTELTFYLFFAFFLGLVIWLRREDRREGYPLEDDLTRRLQPMGGFTETPAPKTYHFGPDTPDAPSPTFVRDSDQLAADRPEVFPGSPLVPRGDPLVSAVGPASWVNRLDRADTAHDGTIKIQPLRTAGHGLAIHPRDPNPIGMTVLGADGVPAGTVTDVWVDVPERLIRYLEVGLAPGVGRVNVNPSRGVADMPTEGAGAPGSPPAPTPAEGTNVLPNPAPMPETAGGVVLVPMPMANVDRRSGTVRVAALAAAQFAGVPSPAHAGSVTRREEERIFGYFGGGYLYATPERAEPFV